jgi:hypothetical protein
MVNYAFFGLRKFHRWNGLEFWAWRLFAFSQRHKELNSSSRRESGGRDERRARRRMDVSVAEKKLFQYGEPMALDHVLMTPPDEPPTRMYAAAGDFWRKWCPPGLGESPVLGLKISPLIEVTGT